MKRSLTRICLAVSGLIAMAGWNNSSALGSSTPASATVAPAVITDIGGLGDRGFNDLAKAGLDAADSDLKIKGRIVVPQTPADYTNDLTQLAQAGAQPVFGIGFTFADAMTQVSTKFPQTHFAIVDSVVDKPNVRSLVFREQEGSYLAGVVAGLMAQRKTPYTNPSHLVVGFIGGQQSPLIEKFGAGYEQGVKSVCPHCKILYQYVGATTQAFSDPGTAAEIARNMHQSGAYVIYHAAGASGDGLFRVATQERFFAIGVNTDQAKIQPTAPILTSVLKRVDVAVKTTIEDQAHGKWSAGVRSYGLANNGIALASFGRFSNLVPASVTSAVNRAKAQIISGKIKVVTTLAGLKK